MPEENTEFDVTRFNAFMAERMRWAGLLVTIQEIAEDNKALVNDLSTYDPTVAVPLLAGLLTLPDYQSHCLRLEILVALAVAYCHGRKKANVNEAQRWFSQIGKSQCTLCLLFIHPPAPWVGSQPCGAKYPGFCADSKGV